MSAPEVDNNARSREREVLQEVLKAFPSHARALTSAVELLVPYSLAFLYGLHSVLCKLCRPAVKGPRVREVYIMQLIRHFPVLAMTGRLS